MSIRADDRAYRELIQQLMLRGWYRIGHGPPDAHDRATWGFREGHLLDTSDANTRWLVAQDEVSAMRKLLAALRDTGTNKTYRDIPVDDDHRDQHQAGSGSANGHSHTMHDVMG